MLRLKYYNIYFDTKQRSRVVIKAFSQNLPVRTVESNSQHSLILGRIVNPGLPEYEVRVLITSP